MSPFHLLLAASSSTWTLVCGGDLMFNGIRPGQAPLSGVASVMREADLAVANLEIPLCTTKERTSRKTKADLKAKRQFVLTASTAHGSSLAEAGIDLVSLANNHAMDAGATGLREMQATLDALRIGYAGAGGNLEEAERVRVVRLPSGVRVGFASYLAFMGSGALWTCTPAAASGAGVATLSLGGRVGPQAQARIRQIVESARRSCDVLLVALHWGIERQSKPTDYQLALGRAFAEAGADVVMGSHPHVLQGFETVRGRLVLYSMGNLVSPRPGSSALYRLKFDGDRFKELEILPVEIKGGKAKLVATNLVESARKKILALNRLLPARK